MSEKGAKSERKGRRMTSHFDSLFTLGQLGEKDEKYKEIVIYLTNCAREEIEAKLGISYNDWLKKEICKDFTIFEWFDYIHYKFDHTDKWHLKLISYDLDRLVNFIISAEKDTITIEKQLFKYPKLREMLMIKEGWGFPLNAKKSHYFINGVSLCRRWMYGGPLERNDESPDNCKECIKRLKKIT